MIETPFHGPGASGGTLREGRVEALVVLVVVDLDNRALFPLHFTAWDCGRCKWDCTSGYW